jgi:ABC-2 type transport system permease protein
MNRRYHNGDEARHGSPKNRTKEDIQAGPKAGAIGAAKGDPTGGPQGDPQGGRPMTVDVEQLAGVRIQAFVGTAIRYWSFIGRGGLSVTIILLVILGMIYYQDLLDLIPEHAPVAPVLAVILTFFVARTAHRTFLEEADLMFLTPLEERMDRYFQRTFRYNLVLQCASVLIVLIVFAPLYVDQLAAEGQSVWPYYIVPLLVKGWNLQSSWSVQKLQDARKIRYHALLRFAFTFLFLYWLLAGGTLGLLALFVMILVVFYIFERRVGEALVVGSLPCPDRSAPRA